MATYAQSKTLRERTARRQRHDARDAARHAAFDAYNAENTDSRGNWKAMKYTRPQFAVVTASDAFRVGYEAINWKDSLEGETIEEARLSAVDVKEGSAE